MNGPFHYLVDASVYIFRSWFSIPDEFNNQAGEPTNAVYGFTGFLCTLLEQTQAEHIALAFDESLSTSFRNEIYPDYKGNREPAPVELKRQFSWCQEVARAMGIACFTDPRYEADDIIGTLAQHWQAQQKKVCVITADKDLTQLIQAGDYWWDFTRQQKLSPAKVADKFGVQPKQIADYLALTGDSVDNIPGVPGIGPKSAAALLQHFDTLDNLYAKVNEVQFLRIRGAKSIQQKLIDHQAAAFLAQRLTEIDCQVPSVLEAPDIRRKALDAAALNETFDRLQFGRLLRQRCLKLTSG